MILLRSRTKSDRCQLRIERKTGILFITPLFVFATKYFAWVWA